MAGLVPSEGSGADIGFNRIYSAGLYSN
uniref:Biopterin-dependent aromatic amino acid hydroxylase family profile domain-containing protein n=1 Tax=Anguilla anguilla TaxID=7936 RepID=A0A0E9RRR6_ANGAN